MSSTLIVYFLTIIGVLLSPIVIFSFFLCGLASLDSNLPSFFFCFLLFAFCLFVSSLLLSCTYQKSLVSRSATSWLTNPKKRSWPTFFGFSPALTSRLSKLRTRSSVSPSPLQNTFGRPNRFWESIFSVCGALSWGSPPLLRACTFSISLSRRMTDPWRLLWRPMVLSILSKSRLFFPIKTSLMVPGLLMVPYLGYYPAFWWWTGIYVVCGIVVNPWFAIFVPFKKKKIFVPFRATDRQTALTRTSADSVGKPGTLLGIVPLTGLRETLRIFRPWPHLCSLRRPVSLAIPIRGFPQHSGETGTRLTTAIHRRLFSRFISEGGETSVHRLIKLDLFFINYCISWHFWTLSTARAYR